MIKQIELNLETIESMLYLWTALAEKEKVAESFFVDVAKQYPLKAIMNKDFNEESVRKVLSAIQNRELLSGASKEEKRFWNNNMWILEDLQTMHNMMAPIKTLNLAELTEKYKASTKFDEIELIFIPAHAEEFYIKGNKIYINFFKLIPNYEDPKDIKIAGLPLKEYVIKKIEGLLH